MHSTKVEIEQFSLFFLIPMIFSVYFLSFSREQESNKSFAGFPCAVRILFVLYPAFPANLSYLSFVNHSLNQL